MKVKDLRAALEGLPEDTLVVLQSDPEGNSYSEAAGADSENVVFYQKEIRYRKLTMEMEEQGYTEEDCAPPGEGQACVVLWPGY